MDKGALSGSREPSRVTPSRPVGFDPARGPYQYQCCSCREKCLGGKYDVICEECRSGHSAALLDAFYGGVPEKFANEERTAGCAAGIPLNDSDRMWLRGIRAAIFANHPLTQMVRLDEAMGLYDDEAIAAGTRESGDAKLAPSEGCQSVIAQTPSESSNEQ